MHDVATSELYRVWDQFRVLFASSQAIRNLLAKAVRYEASYRRLRFLEFLSSACRSESGGQTSPPSDLGLLGLSARCGCVGWRGCWAGTSSRTDRRGAAPAACSGAEAPTLRSRKPPRECFCCAGGGFGGWEMIGITISVFVGYRPVRATGNCTAGLWGGVV